MEWKNLLSLERQVEKEEEPLEFEKYPIFTKQMIMI